MIGAITAALPLIQAGVGLFGGLFGGRKNTRAIEQAAQRVSEAAGAHREAVGQARTFQDIYRELSKETMEPTRRMLGQDIALYEGLRSGKDVAKLLPGDVEASNIISRQFENIGRMSPTGVTGYDTGGGRKFRQAELAARAMTQRDAGQLLAQRYGAELEGSRGRIRQGISDILGEERFTNVELPQNNITNQAGVVGSYAQAGQALTGAADASEAQRQRQLGAINQGLRAAGQFAKDWPTRSGSSIPGLTADPAAGRPIDIGGLRPTTMGPSLFGRRNTGFSQNTFVNPPGKGGGLIPR